MENQSSSSGIFSKDSLDVDVQRHWLDRENCKECLSNSEKVKNYAKKGFPRGQWSFLGQAEEEKWYGTYTYKLEGKWNSTAVVMLDIFKESGQPIFRGISALNRGVLKRKGGRCTGQLTAELTNTELLFRTIHSANQLSIHGAAWCDDLARQDLGQTHMVMEKSVSQANKQLNRKLEPQEVNSLVQTPRRNDGAAGNRLRDYIQQFEERTKEVKFTKACEFAGFTRRVSTGMHCKNIHYVNDGFDGNTAACREYTVHREHPNIPNQTVYWMLHKIWSSSSSQNYILSWHQRNRNSDPFYNRRRVNPPGLVYPEATIATWKSYITMIQISLQEAMNCWIKWTSGNRLRARWTYLGALGETLASQPRVQSNPVISIIPKNWFRLKEESGMTLLPYQHFRGHTLESSIWKLVMKLVRHLDQKDRETDGAVHSVEIDGCTTATRVSRRRRTHHFWFWLAPLFSGKVAIKPDFNVANIFRRAIVRSRNSRTHSRRRDRTGADGSCRYSTQMEGILLFHWGCSFDVKINPSCSTHRRRNKKAKKGAKQYSSHHQTLGKTRQKKTSTTTRRSREKYTITANGSSIRTPSAESIWRRHKKRDWSFGRRGLMPLLFTIQCRPTASKKWLRQGRERTFISDDSRSTLWPGKMIILIDVITIR